LKRGCIQGSSTTAALRAAASSMADNSSDKKPVVTETGHDGPRANGRGLPEFSDDSLNPTNGKRSERTPAPMSVPIRSNHTRGWVLSGRARQRDGRQLMSFSTPNGSPARLSATAITGATAVSVTGRCGPEQRRSCRSARRQHYSRERFRPRSIRDERALGDGAQAHADASSGARFA
jgi:hypothetical protein